jgi:hypothetical protein
MLLLILLSLLVFFPFAFAFASSAWYSVALVDFFLLEHNNA